MIINIVSKDHVYKFVLYTHRQTEVGWETLPSNETIEENQQSVENWRQSNRTKILWYCNYCYQRGETCWGDKQTQSSQLTELTWKINFYSWTTVAANIFGSFHFSNATNGNTWKMVHIIKSLAKEYFDLFYIWFHFLFCFLYRYDFEDGNTVVVNWVLIVLRKYSTFVKILFTRCSM